MAEIKISLDSKEVSDLIKRLSSKLEDMTPAFKDIADLELSQTRLRFKNEEDPDGNKWPDSNTIRRGSGKGTGSGSRTKTTGWNKKDAMGYFISSNFRAAPPGWHLFDSSGGDKILRDTGTLFNSIGRSYSKDSAIVGTNNEYAEKHQEGDGVKQRAFIGINQKTVQNVQKIFDQYIKSGMKK